MTRRAWIAVLAACAACGGKRPSGESGRIAAAGLLAGVAAAAAEQAPWRCARGDGPPLELPATAIAVIADARAPSDATLAALAALHRAFKDAGVGVVVTAGGMGTAQPELERTLGVLVDPAWTLVALPGAAESVSGLRGAIAALHGKGAAIVDGTRTSVIDTHALRVVMLPGDTSAPRLAAGSDGCVRDRADIDAALARLGTTAVRSERLPQVVISTTAPRGRGPSSDLAPGGIHAGEPDLAAALAQHGAELVVHPQLGAPPANGAVTVGNQAVIAAGIADASPRFDDGGRRLAPTALVVTVDRSGIRWQTIVAAPP